MYIDLIIFILAIIAVVAFFRTFSSFVYLVISLDILYRLLHFASDNLNVPELSTLINKYIPTDVVGLVSKYTGTSGIFYTILIWAMFGTYCVFLFFTSKSLVKKNI